MKKIVFIIVFSAAFTIRAQQTPETLGIKLINSIACSPVQDQYLSSTCWSFAGNSFLESELLLKTGEKINLSEMYIARYSYINKMVQYLAQNGKIFFTPGGQFHDILKVIKQYGIVPEAVYNGKPNGELNHNQARLDTLMTHFAQSLLKQGKTKPATEDLVYINKILDQWLGKVPVTFLYKGRSYTPLTFTKKVLQFNAGDYIELTSYTHHPFYKYFVLEDKYNWTKDNYFNIPLTDLMQITDSALVNGYTVCWDGDVTETGFQYETGIANLNYTVTDFVQERQQAYQDKSSTIDHMMQITGTAVDNSSRKWYYIKNSWGDYSNKQGGYLYMQEDYFKIKTIAIIVNKNAIPAVLRRKMNF
jgi:bleomycin hydrolase